MRWHTIQLKPNVPIRAGCVKIGYRCDSYPSNYVFVCYVTWNQDWDKLVNELGITEWAYARSLCGRPYKTCLIF